MAFGKSKGTNKQKQTSDTSGTQGPDAVTQGRVTDIYNAAQAAGGQVPTGVSGAQDFYGNAQTYGQQGAAALGGDPTAVARYMNPYQDQVMNRMFDAFGRQNALTSKGVNDAATRAGAFGGSRHGVAEGVALGENGRNQQMQVASLLQGGYNDAMGRAAQSAELGFNAAGAGANLGMTAGNPDLWRMNILRQGFQGMPYGTTYTGRGRQDSSGVTSTTSLGFGK